MAATKFSLENAKQSIRDILYAFAEPENAAKLDEARDNAGNDMIKFMQLVFPVATQMQMPVIMKYGFTGDGDGLIRFTQATKAYEKQDTDMATLMASLRQIMMPSVAAPSYDSSSQSLVGKQV